MLPDFEEEPTGQYYPVTDKRTGKTYKMEWNEDRPPDKYDVYQYIDEQEKPKSTWEKLNSGLTDLPSRAGKAVAGSLWRYGESEAGKGALGSLARGAAAGSEAVGDITSSLTSPISLGLAAITGGTGIAARTGARGIAEGLNTVTRGAGAAQMAHGGYQAYKGYEEGDTAKALSGVVEGALGTFGARSRVPGVVDNAKVRPGTTPDPFADGYLGRSRPKLLRGEEPIPVNRNTATYGPPKDSYGGTGTYEGEVVPPRESPLNQPPQGATGRPAPRRLQPMPPPALPRRGGSSYSPPETPTDPYHTYFQGPKGTSDLLGDVEELPSPPSEPPPYGGGDLPTSFGVRSRLAALRNFGRRTVAPAEAPVAPRNSSPGEGFYQSGTTLPDITGGPGLQQLPVPESPIANRAPVEQKPVKEIIPRNARKLGSYANDDLEFMALDGDKEALAELKQPERASYWSRIQSLFGGEEGAVGKNIREDPKIKNRQSRRDFLKTIYEGTKPIDELVDLAKEVGWGHKELYDAVMDSPVVKQNGPKGRALKAKFSVWGLKNGIVSDAFDSGKFDAVPDDAPSYIKQMFDSLRARTGNEKGELNFKLPNININGWSPSIPKFLREKELPTQFQDWIGERQVARYKFRGDKVARKVANDIANEKFRGWLSGQGYIDPNYMGKGMGKLLDTAPEDLRTAMKNYRTEPNEYLKFLADKASLSKNFAMSAGIPYTGINAHGFNILARTVMGNPKEALTAGKYIFHPGAAEMDFNAIPKEQVHFAIKKGLTLTTEGHEIGTVGSTNLAGKTLQGVLKLQGKMFEDPLFQKILPALKIKHFNDMVDDLVQDGVSRELAGRQAAKFTNNLYGGQNWEQLGASPDLQNVARMAVLAPDWLQSNINLGKGAVRSLLDSDSPASKQYKKMVAGLLGSYIAADIVNYTVSEKHMWENDPGHALDIHIGQSGDKQRYIRPFGTAADFARLPLDFLQATFKGDLGQGFRIMKNRMSIPATSTADLLMNENRFGRPIYGKDVYGKQIPVKKQAGGIIGEIADTVTPQYVRGGIDYASGNAGGEESVMGGIEMPFRYSHTPRGAAPRRVRRRR